ncbi:MAG TPA: hypothetical protein VGN34_33795, partial [Ktedonobacteraceae bacterium]
SLSGHIGEGTCFLLTDSGQAAQQLFLSTLRALFGDYASYIPVLRPKYLTPSLAGARIATIPAHAFLSSYDPATLATLIDAEPLPIPASSSSSYQSRAKLWFSAPDLPLLPAALSYLRTRFTILPITLSLSNHEACQLTQQLLEVLPAILAWAVQGYMLWSIEGLRPPEPVTAASATYQDEQDGLSSFFEDCCTLGDDLFTVRAHELYQAYGLWSHARGMPRLSEYTFGRLILLRGFRRSRLASGRLYHGLTLTVPFNQLPTPNPPAQLATAHVAHVEVKQHPHHYLQMKETNTSSCKPKMPIGNASRYHILPFCTDRDRRRVIPIRVVYPWLCPLIPACLIALLTVGRTCHIIILNKGNTLYLLHCLLLSS